MVRLYKFNFVFLFVMEKLSKSIENQELKMDDNLDFNEEKNKQKTMDINDSEYKDKKRKADELNSKISEFNSKIFELIDKMNDVKIFGKSVNVFVIIYVVVLLIISHWTFLIIIFFVSVVGYFVERHRRRINSEIEKWIVHKYELKDNKIWDKHVIIEFAPPKWLSPIEIWYLYDMKIWESDIVCLLYKWAKMWIISLSYRDGWLLLVEKKWLISDKNVPNYEIELRNLFFELWNTVVFPNNFLYEDLWNFKNSVKEYCKEKWWIVDENVYFSVDDFFRTIIPWKKPERNITYIPYGRLSWFTLWFVLIIMWAFLFLGSIILGKMVVICGIIFACLFVVWMVISFSFAFTLTETANKHAIKLTEKWQEIAAEIHWYKRFLEACEERQFREFMRQDPLYLDKMLPYAIALGLENIVSQNLPKNLSVEEWSLTDFLRFEKVI